MLTAHTLPPPSPATERRAKGRPTETAAAALRARFLDEALAAFLRDGYAGASINAMAEAAGVSKATVYRVFGSKEDIFRAAAFKGSQWSIESVKRVIDPNGAPEDVLYQVILHKLRAAQKPQAVAVTRMVIAEAHRFPDIAAAQWADHRYLLDPIVEYLQAQNAQGTLRIENPATAALQLSMLAGGGFRTLLDKPLTRTAQEAWAKSVLHLCLNSWKTGSPQRSPNA